MAQATPLARHPVLDTCSVEAAESALGAALSPCRIHKVPERSRFRVTLNSVRLGRTSLVFNRYGAEAHLETDLHQDVLCFTFGRRAPSTFTGAGRSLIAAPDRVIVPRAGCRHRVHRSDESELLVVRVSTAGLARHARRLTGADREDTPTFEPEVSASERAVKSLHRLLAHLDEELAENESLTNQPFVLRAYDEILLSRLLALPHSLRRRFEGGRRHVVMPRLVQHAEEYLRNNLERAISLSDLLDAVACSRSVLYRAFQTVRGYTPMEFLTDQRLQRARQKLRQRDRADSVTDIALSCGFRHLGRFAQAYAHRFGERPSETLRGPRS